MSSNLLNEKCKIVNVYEILARISTEIPEFIVLRGKESILAGNFRDIDCYVGKNDLFRLFSVLDKFEGRVHSSRVNGICIDIRLADKLVTLDVHFSLNVHGVVTFEPSGDFLKSRREVIRGIAFYSDEVEIVHAHLICLFGNRGLLPKRLTKVDFTEEVAERHAELITSATKFDGRKIVKYTRRNTRYSWRFAPVIISIAGLSNALGWIKYIWSAFHIDRTSEVLYSIYQSGVISVLNKHMVDKGRTWNIVLNRDGDVRFVCVSKDISSVFVFISRHSAKSLLKFFALKALSVFKIGFQSSYIFDDTSLVSVQTNRRLVSCFFGTRSIDRTILLLIERGGTQYFVKFKGKDLDGDVKQEFLNLRKYSRLSKSLLAPRAFLLSNNVMLQRKQASRPYLPSSFLGSEQLKFYLSDQKLAAQKVALCEFLERLEAELNAVLHGRYYAAWNKLLILYKNTYFQRPLRQEFIYTSWSHGDFTPWNVLWDGKRFKLIDFEKFCNSGSPLGLDLMTYLVAPIIFENRRINKAMERRMRSIFLKMEGLNGINACLQFDISLVVVLSKYLQVASNSPNQLIQYDWLLNACNHFSSGSSFAFCSLTEAHEDPFWAD
jgi:hypothetical protein